MLKNLFKGLFVVIGVFSIGVVLAIGSFVFLAGSSVDINVASGVERQSSYDNGTRVETITIDYTNLNDEAYNNLRNLVDNLR
jgi:hypothetical protein